MAILGLGLLHDNISSQTSRKRPGHSPQLVISPFHDPRHESFIRSDVLLTLAAAAAGRRTQTTMIQPNRRRHRTKVHHTTHQSHLQTRFRKGGTKSQLHNQLLSSQFPNFYIITGRNAIRLCDSPKES